jgi:hypothetical protein
LKPDKTIEWQTPEIKAITDSRHFGNHDLVIKAVINPLIHEIELINGLITGLMD